MRTLENIRDLVGELMDVMRDHIRGGGQCSPTVLIFPSVHPHTGAPNVEPDAAIVLEMPDGMEKDDYATVARSLCIASNAYAVVTMYESWMVKRPVADFPPSPAEALADANARGIIPRLEPDREEAIAASIQMRDDRLVRIVQSFTRGDDGAVSFAEERTRDGKLEEMTGRFSIMPEKRFYEASQLVIDETVAVARDIARMSCPTIDFIREFKRKEVARA